MFNGVTVWNFYLLRNSTLFFHSYELFIDFLSDHDYILILLFSFSI